MADTFHPRLTEILEGEKPEDASTAVAEQPETPAEAEESPATGVTEEPTEDQSEQPEGAEQPVDDVSPQPEEDHYTRLDKRNAYAELSKLDQDPFWREHLRTFGGRKAKKEYEGRLTLLEKELTAERQEKEHWQFQVKLARTLSEEGEDAVQELLRTDPEFARKYHSQPEKVDLSQVQEGLSLNNHIQDLFEMGMQYGIPQQRIQQYEQALASGYFDYANLPDGQPDKSRPLSPYQSVSKLQAMLTDEGSKLRAQQNQPPPQKMPPPPKPAPKANPALAAKGPDLTDSGPPKRSDGKLSMEEYRKLTPPEKLNRWPDKGLQDLLNEGIVENTP